MKNPNIKKIMTSTDLFTEPLSFNVIATTSKFRTENPKLYAAFRAALAEATDFINKDKKRAAQIYLDVTKDKMPLDELVEILGDPAIQYTTKVGGINAFVSFMAKTGTLKNPAGRLEGHVLRGIAVGVVSVMTDTGTGHWLETPPMPVFRVKTRLYPP